MNDYDSVLFTQRYVFGRDTASGTLSTNDDYNEHIRPLSTPKPPAVEYDMLDYLENGAGRYAIPAVFPIVDDFFTAILDVDTYDISEIRQELDLTDPDDFKKATKTSIWQYGTDTTSFDFAERAYIFGSTNFKLDLTNAEFEVTDQGNKFITGMQVIAKDDNFDFQGGAGPINAVANKILLPAYDPYGLGDDPLKLGNREVPIKYTTSTSGRTYGTSSDPYSESDWVVDDIYETTNISIAGTASGAAKLAVGIGQFFNSPTLSPALAGSYLLNINSDPFLRYLRDDFKVIYGTPGNDNLTHLDRENDLFDPLPINTPVLMVGGTGNDNMTGSTHSDELLGGDNNDVLNGRKGNDTLNGGANNDNLDGGSGEDIAIYSDPYADAGGNPNYDIDTNNNTKVTTITHLNGGIDGTDTLKNVEFAQFNGGQQEALANSNNAVSTNSATDSAPAFTVPLPLEDGVEDTETIEVASTANPNPNDPPTPPYVSLTAPVDMLDGNIEYTVNISPFKPDTEFNISYIVSTSPRTSGVKGQQVKDALIDLNDYFVEIGVAENSKFAVIPFNEQAYLYRDLTSSQAATTIQNLTTFGDYTNKYNDALFNAALFTAQSSLDKDLVTNIAYFIADGKSYQNFFDPYDYSYHLDAQTLRAVSNVQAFGLDVPHSWLPDTST